MTGSPSFRLGLVTCHTESSLTADDALLLPHFENLGIQAKPVVWNDPATDLSAFDALLLRSVWDYHLQADAFLAWVRRLELSGMPLWNEPRTVAWNANKAYLLDLRERGIRIPETVLIRHIDDPVPESILSRPLVVKPSVSAEGYRTHSVRSSDRSALDHALRDVLAHAPALVQEYLPEVVQDGEVSLVFIEGVFCHAVIKTPRTGEFRVQEEHGGTMTPFTPSTVMVAEARRCLGILDATPLYARIDGVRRGDSLVLMELELIEPSLYFVHGPDTASRLASAVHHRRTAHG